MTDLKGLNWTSYVMGLAVVGLEAGFIFMYRMGWNLSTGSLVVSIAVAVVLLVAGVMFYNERLGTSQIIGIICCLAGLVLINWPSA